MNPGWQSGKLCSSISLSFGINHVSHSPKSEIRSYKFFKIKLTIHLLSPLVWVLTRVYPTIPIVSISIVDVYNEKLYFTVSLFLIRWDISTDTQRAQAPPVPRQARAHSVCEYVHRIKKIHLSIKYGLLRTPYSRNPSKIRTRFFRSFVLIFVWPSYSPALIDNRKSPWQTFIKKSVKDE